MLTYSFHISQFISFPGKNPSLAQFIPRIYNKILIKILGYFWGVIDVVEEGAIGDESDGGPVSVCGQ